VIDRREQETIRLAEELVRKEKEIVSQREALLELEKQLRAELEFLGGERTRLVTKEKSIVEVERYLASALEAAGVELPSLEAPVAPKPVERTHEKVPERPVALSPEPPKVEVAPPPSTPKRKESIDEDFEKAVETHPTPRTTKNDAVERMTKALEVAKRARDSGQDVTEVRRILKQARAAFDAGNYDEAVKESDRILDMLRLAPVAH